MAYTLNNIPVQFKDELIDGVLAESVIAKLAPTMRMDLGSNLVQLSLGLQPAGIVAGTTASNLPGEGEQKPVQGVNEFVNAQTYKFAQIIPVSAEYQYKLNRLYEAIIENAPKTIALGVDNVVFNDTTAHQGMAGFAVASNPYAPAITATGTTAGDVAAAFNAVAAEGFMPTAVAATPAFAMAMRTATNTAGYPVFPDGNAYGTVTEVSKIMTANAAYVGDWSKTRFGIVDDIRLKILEEATLTVGNSTLNLAQNNLIGILVEGWCAFACAEGAFAAIPAE